MSMAKSTMRPRREDGTSGHHGGVGEFNCEVVTVEMKDIGSSTMKELQTDGITPLSCIVDFTINIPCIRNTEEIAPGAEIVLKWETKKNIEATETAGKKKLFTAFNPKKPKLM